MIPGDKVYYPGTDVLINKYDIRDAKAATTAEYKFASARELQLRENPIRGKFDLAHLQSIHKHVFQDMYEWAGQLREVDFAKRHKDTGFVSRFTPVDDMAAKSEELAKFIEKNNQLKGLSKLDFVKTITEVHSKLNELHPFREGNGRSARVFLTQLAREAGYEFDITKIDKDRWNLASHKAMMQYHPKDAGVQRTPSVMDMRQIFHEACKPIVAERDISSSVNNTESKSFPYTEKQEMQSAKARDISKSPPHAIAFDKLPPREAFQQYPELEGAYRVLAQAKKFAEANLKSPQDQQTFFNKTRERISAELHQGKEVEPRQPDLGRTR